MTETLAVLTIIAQIVTLFLLVLWFKNRKKQSKLYKNVKRFTLPYAFVTAMLATFGSLYYSEIAHFEPCKYCWFQRILMYPLFPIIWIGMKLKDKNLKKYVLSLSIPGTLLAGYHYLTQLGLLPSTCLATGYSVGCAKVFVMTFGYITIPMMSFTAFLLITVIMLLPDVKEKK